MLSRSAEGVRSTENPASLIEAQWKFQRGGGVQKQTFLKDKCNIWS